MSRKLALPLTVLCLAVSAPQTTSARQPSGKDELFAAGRAGIQAYNKGDYKTALRELLKAAEHSEEFDERDQIKLHTFLGFCQVAFERRPEAKAQFKQALKIRPTLSLSESMSPKILEVFREAKVEFTAERAEAKAKAKREAETAAAKATAAKQAAARVARAAAASPKRSPWRIRLQPGVVASMRSRDLRDDTGARPNLSASGFAGAGAGVDFAALHRSGFMTDAAVRWVSYDLTQVRIANNLAPQPADPFQVRGGWTLDGFIGVGYRLAFLKTSSVRPAVSVLVGGAFERHEARDVSDGSGRVGVLSSHTFFAPDARLRGTITLQRFTLSAGGGVRPFGSWIEDPIGQTGADPAPDIATTWEGGLHWRPGTKWVVSGVYRGLRRSVRFEGDGNTRVNPVFTNAVIEETIHTGVVSIRRIF